MFVTSTSPSYTTTSVSPISFTATLNSVPRTAIDAVGLLIRYGFGFPPQWLILTRTLPRRISNSSRTEPAVRKSLSKTLDPDRTKTMLPSVNSIVTWPPPLVSISSPGKSTSPRVAILGGCAPVESKAVPLTLAMRASTDVTWARAAGTEHAKASATPIKTWMVLPRIRPDTDPAVKDFRRLALWNFRVSRVFVVPFGRGEQPVFGYQPLDCSAVQAEDRRRPSLLALIFIQD